MSAIKPLTMEEKEALNQKYGKIKPPGSDGLHNTTNTVLPTSAVTFQPRQTSGASSSSFAPAPPPPKVPRPASAIRPLTADEKDALNKKYGRIKPPDPEDLRKTAEECKMQ